MFPDNQNQNGGQPGYGAAPAPQQPVQAPNGQYQVLPPLPVGQNNGHSGHNPYEFIVNPNTPKHRVGLAGSFGMKIGLLVGGAALLMIVIAVLMSALGPKSVMPQLTEIAQQQQEIIRIASDASDKASGTDTTNFVTNVALSVTTSQNEVIAYATSHGQKLPPKVLALKQDAKTDTLLANAANAGTYDRTVASTLSDELTAYEGQLQKTYKATSSKKVKQLLQDCFTTASKLVQQAKNLPGNSD